MSIQKFLFQSFKVDPFVKTIVGPQIRWDPPC
jgi:hypothetical protein